MVKGKRVVVVTSQLSSDCSFDVYIDGKKQSKKDGELYRIETSCKDHTAKEIKIIVHEGSLIITKSDSVGHYPLLVKGKWSTIKIPQEFYIHWLDGSDSFPKVLVKGDTITYNHLIPNGPSYVEYHIDYDMKPVTNNVVENTKLVESHLNL